jgi:hypothetical protein
MRGVVWFAATLFLAGCKAFPASAPPVDGGAPAEAVVPPEANVPRATADGGVAPVATIDGGVPSVCAEQIDPGTRQPIVLHGIDDRDLFYVAPYDLSALMALRKDGSAPARTLMPIDGVQKSGREYGYDVAVDDQFAYYINDGSIWRIAKSGGTPTQLTAPRTEDCRPMQLALTTSEVWFIAGAGCIADETRPVTRHVAKTGGTALTGSFVLGGGIIGDGVTACWGPQVTNVSCVRDGASFAFDTGVPVSALAVDGDRVIIGGSDGGVRVRASDGTLAIAAQNGAAIAHLAARDGRIWFASERTLHRVDSAGPTAIWTGTSPPGDLVVDDGYVYFQTSCNIARVPR